MKTIQLTKVIVAAMALLTITSCVNDDDFSLPNLTIEEPQIEGEIISVSALRDLFLQEGETVDLNESTAYVEGYVVSSDESGNWFEELIIQDASSNPTAGVRVLIDNSPLFTDYEVGRKIFVKLGGLHLGDSNGVLTLGITNNLEKIPAPLQFEYIERATEVAEIVPLEVGISDFNESLENVLITLTDVQFVKEETVDTEDGLPFTFAGEPLDEFDGERTLIACANNQTVILATSTFADFKSIALPVERGSITGVLTRNFFGDTFNLVLNDINGISFENAERCDPVEIDCGVADSAGAQVLFEDFFETQSTNQPISGNGWTNYIQEGTQAWEAFTSGGANASLGISANVGSFMSGDDSSVAWLVAPQINFDNQDGETLQFQTSNSFSDGSTLELLFSSDWDGTPENIPTASWDVLPAAVLVQDSDFFGDWISSGIVDLSCIEGAGYIGFRYIGNGDADFDGTYELDEIQINAQ
jgi:hypothetical protein